MKVEMKSTVDITVPLLAQIFCELNDEDQCDFFVEIAKYVEANGGQAKWDMQWCYLGGHLRNCECSTEGARQVIESIAEFMKTSTHN
jgi:hypothetical protein